MFKTTPILLNGDNKKLSLFSISNLAINREYMLFMNGRIKKMALRKREDNNFEEIILSTGHKITLSENDVLFTLAGEKLKKNLTVNDYLPFNLAKHKGNNLSPVEDRIKFLEKYEENGHFYISWKNLQKVLQVYASLGIPTKVMQNVEGNCTITKLDRKNPPENCLVKDGYFWVKIEDFYPVFSDEKQDSFVFESVVDNGDPYFMLPSGLIVSGTKNDMKKNMKDIEEDELAELIAKLKMPKEALEEESSRFI